jgi:uncharacterized protein
MAVVTLPSLEGGQIDDFAHKVFQQRGVGKKGRDNGLLLLVAVQDRKARIEVGWASRNNLPFSVRGETALTKNESRSDLSWTAPLS